MKEEPDSVPAASPRLPRSISPWSPGRSSKPTQEFPTRNGLGRTALGPYPPGSSRSSLEKRKRRFLAYSFPSRSPDPHHLAVLARSDFVGAACHPLRHHPDRAAPSFTVLLRQERRKRSHTSSRTHSASRHTQRRPKIDPFTTGEFDTGVRRRRQHDRRTLGHGPTMPPNPSAREARSPDQPRARGACLRKRWRSVAEVLRQLALRMSMDPGKKERLYLIRSPVRPSLSGSAADATCGFWGSPCVHEPRHANPSGRT